MAKSDVKEEKAETKFVEGDYSPVQPPLTDEQVEAEKTNFQREVEWLEAQEAEVAGKE